MKNMNDRIPRIAKCKHGIIIGGFDMFNIHHLNFIKQAKEQCDYLIVGIYTDECKINDKKRHVIIPFADRARIVQSVCYVDEVVPIENIHLESIWQKHPFDVFFEITDADNLDFLRGDFYQIGETQVSVITLKNVTIPQEMPFREMDSQGKKVVGYTTGVYDMFHIGHLNILERAKSQCDFLIVGVSTDENVLSYKHKRPIVPFEERAAIIESIRYVDAVVPQKTMDKFAAWEKLHFNVMFHGDDWKGSAMYNELETKLKSVGCETRFLPHTDGISTSILREKLALK